MKFTETKLKGAFIIEVEKLEDERGFFGRSWCANEMKAHGLNTNICQANFSVNKAKATLRGMHYQVAPYQETKMVRCTRGSIYDVIIDLRTDSPTFKKWIAVELTQDNYKMIYIPEDFAHGFITLVDNTEITYLMTEFYMPRASATIRWNDPMFNVKWPLEPAYISGKDKSQPDFKIIP